MCIIAHMEPNIVLPKENFDKCATSNGVGFGMMYAYKGKLNIFKTMDKSELWTAYSTIADSEIGRTSPVVLHFRLATSGSRDVSSAHPFYVIDDKLGFCHNGVISAYTNHGSKLSDTQHYNEEILKGLGLDVINSEASLKLIESHVGSSNKLIFMDYKGNVSYVNPKGWTWDNDLGINFSNQGYKVYTPPPTSTSSIIHRDNTTTNSRRQNLSLCFACGEKVGRIGTNDAPYGIKLTETYVHVCPKCASEWTIAELDMAYYGELNSVYNVSGG